MTQPYTGYTPPEYPTTPVPIEEPSAAVEAIELLIKAGMAGLFVAFLLLMLVFLLRQFLLISRPNEALVFSGKKSRGPNGETLPYAIVKQGARGIRIPILHRVDRMDMRLLPVDIRIQNAYSAGNIPLHIHAIATGSGDFQASYAKRVGGDLGCNVFEVTTGKALMNHKVMK